ncbi:MAG: KTSC domain-containing protein [Nitrospiraceae bacterium]|nr:MAG: KTSC domain-containing protein [Nitrospiraceae bacterium]
MDRQLVRSSNIRSVGYDPAIMILEIEFHSGNIYQYLSVPENVYQGLLQASSKGSYFQTYIKEHFSFRQVR